MKLTTLLLIFTFSVFNSCDSFAGESQLEKYVIDFFSQSRPQKMNRALKHVPMVIYESQELNFDPLLIGVIISLESGWNSNAISDDGYNTIGLMQVHPDGPCSTGYRLKDPRENVQAGLNCLARCRSTCDGTLKQTLTKYASGRCRSKSERTKRMIERRIRIYERWKR